MIASAVSSYGKLDILVNIAGIAVLKPIAELTVNLTSIGTSFPRRSGWIAAARLSSS